MKKNINDKMRLSNIYQINRYTDRSQRRTRKKTEEKKTQPSRKA